VRDIGDLVFRNNFDAVEAWRQRRIELRDQLFARFGTAKFQVYDAAKPQIFRVPPDQRRRFLGVLAGEVERLVAEGVFIAIPEPNKPYPSYRIRTPADVARDGPPSTIATIDQGPRENPRRAAEAYGFERANGPDET
jgi:hypothetical protein